MASGTIFSLGYDFHLSNGDNGNVYQIVNNKDNNRTQNFSYDTLNRIQQAWTTGPNWGETFTFDSWGNLTNRGQVAGKTYYEPLSVSATTANQLVGFSYDAAGNMVGNGGATYAFDAENRLTSAGGFSYVYDGDGKRVKKASGSNGTLYWPSATGESLVESTLSANPVSEYVFFAGNRVARRDVASNSVHYYLSDHLGSTSVVTDSNGTIQNESDYYPYGGEIAYSTGDGNHYKFTGKERDSESGLDYFGFRYHASTMGRFMTPDPAGMMAVDVGSPQTLNRYAYVINNPLSLVDPFGLDCVYLNSSGTGVEKGGIDQNSSSRECGRTGGYWVEGAVTNVTIGGDAETVSLTGTTNGTDNNTQASYQQNTTLSVGMYFNTPANPADHIAFGNLNGPQWGLNPRSDWQFFKYRMGHPRGGGPGVPGAVRQQVGGTLDRMARVPATGMQAQMVQNGINQGIQNPPNYDIGGGPHTCDCASWPQQVLGDAGINTGPPTQVPNQLMNQLDTLYPQQQ